MKKLRLATRAERDIVEIGDWFALENRRNALEFVSSLRARLRLIADFPESAALRPEIATNIRAIVHRGYLILYSVREDEILVERIVHGARHLPDVL